MLVRAEVEPLVSILDKNGCFETRLMQVGQKEFKKSDREKAYYINLNGRIAIPLKTGETIYIGFA